MHLIVYTSEYVITDEEIRDVLKDIRDISKIKNAKQNITGFLFYHSRRFIQLIEGDKDRLEGLMNTLFHDTRHKNIKYLINEPIKERSFSKWNMDTLNLDHACEAAFEKNLIKLRDIYKGFFVVTTSDFLTFMKKFLNDPQMIELINA